MVYLQHYVQCGKNGFRHGHDVHNELWPGTLGRPLLYLWSNVIGVKKMQVRECDVFERALKSRQQNKTKQHLLNSLKRKKKNFNSIFYARKEEQKQMITNRLGRSLNWKNK